MAIGVGYRPGYVSQSNRRVEVDGWSAGSPGDIDAQGTVWYLRKVEGWQEGPSVRLGMTSRPAEHGAFDGPAFLEPRIVTLSGTAVGSSYAGTKQARDIMASVLGDPTLGLQTLTIRAPGYLPMQADVRRSDVVKTTERGKDGLTFDWSLIAVAPDPLRYSTVLTQVTTGLPIVGAGGLVFPLVFPLVFGAGTAGGDLTVTNTGTIATWPILTLTGPLTGPSITNVTTGQTLAFLPSFSIAAGQSVVIDTKNRLVTLAGVNRRNAITTAEWFRIATGSQVIRLSAVSAYDPAATLTVSFREAWT
jgi:hypothetical protein